MGVESPAHVLGSAALSARERQARALILDPGRALRRAGGAQGFPPPRSRRPMQLSVRRALGALLNTVTEKGVITTV